MLNKDLKRVHCSLLHCISPLLEGEKNTASEQIWDVDVDMWKSSTSEEGPEMKEKCAKATLSMVVKIKISALVVDDDATIRMLYKKLVEVVEASVEVDCEVAETGKVAVDLFLSGKSFDLILMDLEMPVMNGVEATKELRKMGVDSMIVGVTSRSKKCEMEAFMAAGLDDFYEKPLQIHALKALLQKFRNST